MPVGGPLNPGASASVGHRCSSLRVQLSEGHLREEEAGMFGEPDPPSLFQKIGAIFQESQRRRSQRSCFPQPERQGTVPVTVSSNAYLLPSRGQEADRARNTEKLGAGPPGGSEQAPNSPTPPPASLRSVGRASPQQCSRFFLHLRSHPAWGQECLRIPGRHT